VAVYRAVQRHENDGTIRRPERIERVVLVGWKDRQGKKEVRHDFDLAKRQDNNLKREALTLLNEATYIYCAT
jgi:hypothetical protein